MILVTGGTGLLGSHLLLQLAQGQQQVRAIYRQEDKFEAVRTVFSYYTKDAENLFLTIEWVKADITDIPSLQDAFRDVTYVYHCAALISFDPNDYKRLRKINIEGTANIVNLCVSHQIKKLCYVSSIATLGNYGNSERQITEETSWNPEQDHNVYAITKYGAELEVWRGTQEGVDAIIVQPGIILGPGYWKGNSSGSIFNRVYKGLKHYTKGVTGYVDVNDVVTAMTQLMASSITNEAFIVVAENFSFKTILTTIAEVLGVTPPKKEATPFLLKFACYLESLRHLLFRGSLRLSRHSAKSLVSIAHYDNRKLKAALDFEFITINDSIKRNAELFLEYKLID